VACVSDLALVQCLNFCRPRPRIKSVPKRNAKVKAERSVAIPFQWTKMWRRARRAFRLPIIVIREIVVRDKKRIVRFNSTGGTTNLDEQELP
jgi:hypothetical protein